MIIKIEHIGIAVESSDAENIYHSLLGTPSYKTERVEREQVETVFYDVDSVKIELLKSLSADSPVGRFLDKKGPGIHHIAFLVDDIQKEMERLRNEGFRLINDEPKEGADNKLICFIHPGSTGGVLIELCQEKPV